MWFSIITAMMVVISGMVSVPGGSDGLGSVPGPGFFAFLAARTGAFRAAAAEALPAGRPIAAPPINAPPSTARREIRMGSLMFQNLTTLLQCDK